MHFVKGGREFKSSKWIKLIRTKNEAASMNSSWRLETDYWATNSTSSRTDLVDSIRYKTIMLHSLIQ